MRREELRLEEEKKRRMVEMIFPCWTFLGVWVNGPWVSLAGPSWALLRSMAPGLSLAGPSWASMSMAPWFFPCWTYLGIVQVNGPWVFPLLDLPGHNFQRSQVSSSPPNILINSIYFGFSEKIERSRYFLCEYSYKLAVTKTPPPQIPCQRRVENMRPFILKLRRRSAEKVDH